MNERATRGMAAIGGGVAAASALSPRAFLRLFGIPSDEVTGAAAFGWRLFAVRTAFISGLAWRGNHTAREAFLPVQVLDQLVFWHAFKTRSIPRRGAVLAATTSGAIIALDLLRRRSPRSPPTIEPRPLTPGSLSSFRRLPDRLRGRFFLRVLLGWLQKDRCVAPNDA